MISNKLKCIFVPVSRVASTSIRRCLRANDARIRRHYFFRHYPLAHYKSRYPMEFDSYFKFGFIRNPWERMVSLYRYLNEHDKIGANGNTFREWLLQCAEAKSRPNAFLFGRSRDIFLLHLTNQLEWFEIDGQQAVDFVGRYENLENDFQTVARRIKIYQKLPHVNRSKSSDKWQECYDDETREIVESWYKRDIRRFDYKFLPDPPNAISFQATILHCPRGIPAERSRVFFHSLAEGLSQMRQTGEIAVVDSPDPQLQIVIANNRKNEMLLEAQLRELRLPATIIAKDWKKWRWAAKIVCTLKTLIESTADRVLCLDASDVLLLKAPDRKHMDKCLHSYGIDSEILFMPTRTRWRPCQDSIDKSLQMAPEGAKSPFLCAGGYYGNRLSILRCLAAITETAARDPKLRLMEDDQRAWNWAFSNGVARIHIDWQNLLFARFDHTCTFNVDQYLLARQAPAESSPCPVQRPRS